MTGFLNEESLFAVFDALPLSTLLSVIAILLITAIFITSADSTTFVLGMQTTHGSLHSSLRDKITWGIAQSSIAIILLFAKGLDALQSTLIVAALG